MVCLNKKRKTNLFWIAIAALLLFASVRAYYNLTDDFRLANISYDMPHHTEWNIPPMTMAEQAKLKNILDQKFYYIGKGAQSYAFGSEDGKYVIKFFKFKHLKPSLFLDLLPPIPPFQQYRLTQAQRKKRKLDGVFAGYHLAYDRHKEASGLVYIHLNKTRNQHNLVAVIDKIGLTHEIRLDEVVFVLQEKAVTLRDVIQKLVKTDEIPLAKHRINQIFDLYLSEYQKGIFDHDHGVMHNTGFVGDKPIHLDVGKLKSNEAMKEPETYLADLELVARKMQGWLRENTPGESDELTKEIETKMSQIAGRPFHF